jgi:hypothetical protein
MPTPIHLRLAQQAKEIEQAIFMYRLIYFVRRNSSYFWTEGRMFEVRSRCVLAEIERMVTRNEKHGEVE